MANVAYRALAVLLDYPSEGLQANVAEVAAALEALGAANLRALRPLLAEVAGRDLLDLQERYVETFDRGRRTSLNLFEHVHGDSRDRGQAMVDLLAMYREVGIELAAEQLPDYLPAFLEYLSLLDEAAARERLGDVAHILQTIGGALARRANPYAAVFDVLLALAGEKPLAAHEIDHEDDTTFEAIDAAWKEEPVNFLDAAAPAGSCGTAPRPDVQKIQIHRRPR
ncbi:nitrate reductase molybdenum cofactor assembly chaperone [Betaproteobacteria bacterium PRO7]|nr:nitrate reductase molybdenum cofactor assembly chaperone [Betaproteobacteria bacterium PRO7]